MPVIKRFQRTRFWSAEITSADERFEALQVLDCLSSGKDIPSNLSERWSVEIVVERIAKGSREKESRGDCIKP
jgi:hypothetical protein